MNPGQDPLDLSGPVPDLKALACAFGILSPEDVRGAIRAALPAPEARRLWFLYEWMTGRDLGLAAPAATLPAVDPSLCFTAEAREPTHHGILDNLPGVPGFCPLVRRTQALEEALVIDWAALAAEAAAGEANCLEQACLLETHASFAIERETPSPGQERRFALAVASAAAGPLDAVRLGAVQAIAVEGHRFVSPGRLRDGHVWIGASSRDGTPRPQAIGAKPSDVAFLTDTLCAADDLMERGGMPGIVRAAAIGYGFVFIHPFDDGNGRTHRWLVQRGLGLARTGCVLPLSTAILNDEDAYIDALQAHGRPVLEATEWRPDGRGNVEVTNDTRAFFSYWDATPQAEHLAGILTRAVEIVAGMAETSRRRRRILEAVPALGDRGAERIDRYLVNTGGRVGRKRRREFPGLSDGDFDAIERAWGPRLGRSSPEPS